MPNVSKVKSSKLVRARYSDEIRKKVLTEIDAGLSVLKASAKHKISTAAIYKWQKAARVAATRRKPVVQARAKAVRDASVNLEEALNRKASDIIENFNFHKTFISLKATDDIGPAVTIADLKEQASETLAKVIRNSLDNKEQFTVADDKLGFHAINWNGEELELRHTTTYGAAR